MGALGRGRRRCLAVVAALCLAMTPVTITAAHADPPVPVPATPSTLPATVEDLAPYVPQDSCDPTDKPGTLALAGLLTATYPDTSIIGTSYGCGADGAVSEHYEGRALDWGVNPSSAHQVAEAHALLAWLFGTDTAGVPAGNARRLGVTYAIYDAQIIGTYNLAAGWRPISCSGVTDCHQDHVHLSLSWAGARGATSWWSGVVAPTDYGPCRVAGFAVAATPPTPAPNPVPCAAVPGPGPAPAGTPAALQTLRGWSGATLQAGLRGPVVAALQTALGVSADGVFGQSTLAALQAFQAAHAIAVSGGTDAATWIALLGLSSTPVPTATPPVAAPPTVRRPVVPVRKGRPILRLGSHGISVMLVQALLRVHISGRYTPVTGNAVRHFQRLRKLPVDGVVGPRTWHALGR